MLRKVVPASLAVLSSLLLILSFPGFNFEFLAWVGFVPLFFALNDKSVKEAFILFFITGAIFWAGVIYWLAHVTLPGTIILIFYLALYFAFFGSIIRPLTRKSKLSALFLIPSVWVLLEYLRAHLFTGFPWALLGYSQYLNLPAIQIADIGGAWVVSFLIMFVNAAIVEIIWSGANRLWTRLKITVISLVLVLFLTFGYGYLCLSRKAPAPATAPVRISVIQGNIPQELKWDKDAQDMIMRKYSGLTLQAAKDNPDLVVWPEAAVPGILGEDDPLYEEIFSLAREIKIPLLVGAVVKDKEDYFGSALLINSSGEITRRYDKLHLVPFGEYIPLKKLFPFLATVVPIGEMKKGKEYTIFSLKTLNFAVLDCFEDVFPELAREFIRHGADFLVNITNDAWYKETSAPYQHLQASVLRAVENQAYLARAANTGVSGFIAPSGKIISLVRDKNGENIFVNGYLTQSISVNRRPLSFYTRYGDIFIYLLIVIMAGYLMLAYRK